MLQIIESACALEENPSTINNQAANISDLKSRAKECLKNLEHDPDYRSNMKWLYRF